MAGPYASRNIEAGSDIAARKKRIRQRGPVTGATSIADRAGPVKSCRVGRFRF